MLSNGLGNIQLGNIAWKENSLRKTINNLETNIKLKLETSIFP